MVGDSSGRWHWITDIKIELDTQVVRHAYSKKTFATSDEARADKRRWENTGYNPDDVCQIGTIDPVDHSRK